MPKQRRSIPTAYGERHCEYGASWPSRPCRAARSAGPPSPRPTRPPADGDRQRRGPARCRQAVLRDLFGLDRLTEAHDLDPNPEAAVECLVKSIRWAQAKGLRGETDTPDKMRRRLEYDLYYIEHWSLLFDLRIIAQTITSRMGDRNAY